MSTILWDFLAFESSVKVVPNSAFFTHFSAGAATFIDPVAVLVNVSILITEILALFDTLTSIIQVIAICALDTFAHLISVDTVLWQKLAIKSRGQVVAFDAGRASAIGIGGLAIFRQFSAFALPVQEVALLAFGTLSTGSYVSTTDR